MKSNALEKALRTLEVFKTGQAPLSVIEISQLTGDAISSVQRNTYTLQSLGYLEREPDGNRYVLGRSCLHIGFGYLRRNKFLEVASPHLIKLSETLGLRCDLTVLDGNEIVYLARFPSKTEVFELSPIGRRWPAISTASGRAILSAMPKTECYKIVNSSEFAQITNNTVTSKKTIIKLIEDAKLNGYAFQFEEVLVSAASVAAPVFSKNKEVLGAILIGGHVTQFESSEYLDRLSIHICRTASTISSYNI